MRLLAIFIGLIGIGVGFLFCARVVSMIIEPSPRFTLWSALLLLVLWAILPFLGGIRLLRFGIRYKPAHGPPNEGSATGESVDSARELASSYSPARPALLLGGVVLTFIGLVFSFLHLGLIEPVVANMTPCDIVADSALLGIAPLLVGLLMCRYSLRWTYGRRARQTASGIELQPGTSRVDWYSLSPRRVGRFLYGCFLVWGGLLLTAGFFCGQYGSRKDLLSAIVSSILLYLFGISAVFAGIANCRRGLAGAADPDERTYRESLANTSHGQAVWRLVVLVMTTWGAYSLYWFYRNWKQLGPYIGQSRNPAYGVLFLLVPVYNFFEVYKQFRSIRVLADQNGVSHVFSPAYLTAGFVLLYSELIFLFFSPWKVSLLAGIGIGLLMVSLTAWLLAIAQRTLNEIWEKLQPDLPMRHAFYDIEGAALLGGLFMLYVLFEIYW